MPKHTAQDIADASAYLRQSLQPGAAVYCILRHVSKSGMSRVIDLVYIRKDGIPLHIGWNASKVLGLSFDREREGITIGGCGMDMGFELVYNLGRVLFPDGFGVQPDNAREECGDTLGMRPMSKEDAEARIAVGEKFYGRNGDTSGWDNDGGYALVCRWL